MPVEMAIPELKKQTARVYVPRITHVPVETVHVLVGVASHAAWKTLSDRYQMLRLKGKSAELHRLTGDLMKSWCYKIAKGG